MLVVYIFISLIKFKTVYDCIVNALSTFFSLKSKTQNKDKKTKKKTNKKHEKGKVIKPVLARPQPILSNSKYN